MNKFLFQKISDDLEMGIYGVICTVVNVEGSTPRDVGASMWVRQNGTISGTIGGGILEKHTIDEALKLMEQKGATYLYKETLQGCGAVCGGTASIFLEVMGLENDLVIFGAGHVGKAVAQAASFAGFRVTTWDERDEFANSQNIPWGKTLVCPLEEIFTNGISFNERTFAVIVTRGHALDSDVVKILEGQSAAYIGLIGSRRKIAFVRQKLADEGVSQAHLDRIFQPIGIPIKAETPEEIAISIVAELIAVLRKADITGLRVIRD